MRNSAEKTGDEEEEEVEKNGCRNISCRNSSRHPDISVLT